jgi:N-acetylglucosaminyldiphosphoundecaprenol N-acetyl-beta-D-mannosaminyltransferase
MSSTLIRPRSGGKSFQLRVKQKLLEAPICSLAIPVVLGVGGAFDILAGLKTRAPMPLQKSGLEWAWRMAQEPKRMIPRYARNGLFLIR